MHKHQHLIIGGGITGLTLAQYLCQLGKNVTLIEKSRGVGGRMSCRRTEQGSFHHGTPKNVSMAYAQHELFQKNDIPFDNAGLKTLVKKLQADYPEQFTFLTNHVATLCIPSQKQIYVNEFIWEYDYLYLTMPQEQQRLVLQPFSEEITNKLPTTDYSSGGVVMLKVLDKEKWFELINACQKQDPDSIVVFSPEDDDRYCVYSHKNNVWTQLKITMYEFQNFYDTVEIIAIQPWKYMNPIADNSNNITQRFTYLEEDCIFSCGDSYMMPSDEGGVIAGYLSAMSVIEFMSKDKDKN